MKHQLICETVEGRSYEYVPLGRYIVSAPAVCRGRPTFKYTRIEAAGVLERLAAGRSVEEIVAAYRGRVTSEAIEEAAALAAKALARHVPARVSRS